MLPETTQDRISPTKGKRLQRFSKAEIFQIFQRVDNREKTIGEFAKELGFGVSTYSHWRKADVLGNEYEQWKLDGTVIEGNHRARVNGNGRGNGGKPKAQATAKEVTPADRIRILKAQKDVKRNVLTL